MERPDRLPPSGDPGHSETRPQDTPSWRHDTTPDAERMGLDRNTVEGAQVAFVASLDGSRRRHRWVAWVIIFLMFGLPMLLWAVQALR